MSTAPADPPVVTVDWPVQSKTTPSGSDLREPQLNYELVAPDGIQIRHALYPYSRAHTRLPSRMIQARKIHRPSFLSLSDMGSFSEGEKPDPCTAGRRSTSVYSCRVARLATHRPWHTARPLRAGQGSPGGCIPPGFSVSLDQQGRSRHLFRVLVTQGYSKTPARGGRFSDQTGAILSQVPRPLLPRRNSRWSPGRGSGGFSFNLKIHRWAFLSKVNTIPWGRELGCPQAIVGKRRRGWGDRAENQPRIL